jgi:hypothetical protein
MNKIINELYVPFTRKLIVLKCFENNPKYKSILELKQKRTIENTGSSLRVLFSGLVILILLQCQEPFLLRCIDTPNLPKQQSVLKYNTKLKHNRYPERSGNMLRACLNPSDL